ncbi:mitogen-activated protein kinase kinase kinase 18-like [Neltuma alba]|uniref:mitogen-activated protein kinase kinase kinase 18-like n=1 Tax=Neltuma alba TaxID=207710 RepID=UPI0010A2E302|nr:mitogen-activated protein kinase kinase kinase 18-like [Prosopis alba]
MEWTRGHTIGRGSTATVSVAEFHGSGRIVAVKSVELQRSECLRREQSILSTLECPHVVAYEGCDTTFENGAFMYNLFMEYAPYGSIADEIRERDGGLDEFMVGHYARQILLGLDYLHSNGIVHCDLKGQNVLLTDEGAKIADLGCARRVSAEQNYGGVIAGTPAFMAPEVARGEQQGFPADVWALGCSVLEMITGKAPWHDISDPVSVLYRVGFSGEVPEIPSFLSEQGKDFLTMCLKTDPNERLSAGELLKHEFVQDSNTASKKFDEPSSNSPTSVLLDRDIWDSFDELQKTQTPDLNPTPTHGPAFSWDPPGPRSRIRRLSSSMPNWECDDEWITVRDSSINGGESNEETENYGLDSSNYIREDNYFIVIGEPRTISTVGLSECCNINDYFCIRESSLGNSQCINMAANRNILHDLLSVFPLSNPTFGSIIFCCLLLLQ